MNSPAELTLEQKLRAAHVKRWHIVNVMREQNVAEHSFLVIVLATEISRRIGYSDKKGGPFNDEKEYHIMRWALWHDLPEVVLGDMPTPAKTMLMLTEADDAAIVSRMPESVSAEYAYVKGATFETAKDIVKLADLIEAIRFIDQEGKGEHGGEVLDGLIEAARKHWQKCKRTRHNLEWDAVEDLIWRRGHERS